MQPSANPTRLAAALRDETVVQTERNLHCPLYDHCLHKVVKAGWEGWSCRSCPLRRAQAGVPHARDFAHARPHSRGEPL